MQTSMQTSILGVNIDPVTEPVALAKTLEFFKSDSKNQIVTVNAEFVVRANFDDEFKKILNDASLSLADGSGILWAAKYLSIKPFSKVLAKTFPRLTAFYQLVYSGFSLIFFPKYCRKPIPEKISGSDLIDKFIALAEENLIPVFLLGAGPGIAEKVKEVFKIRYPKVKISGTFAGSTSNKDEEQICQLINKTDAKLLLTAFSFPKQEKWISRNLKNLQNINVAVGLGGAFDFIASTKAVKSNFGLKSRRAPQVLRKLGLEWLFRLVTQPYRIKRVYNAVIRFTRLIFKEKVKQYNLM